MKTPIVNSPGDILPEFSSLEEGIKNLYNLLMQVPAAIVVFRGPDYIIELANDLYLPTVDKSREELLNKPVFDLIAGAAEQGFRDLLDKIRLSGERFELHEHETFAQRRGKTVTTYLNITYQPLKEADGSVDRVMVVVVDVTDQVNARKKAEESEEFFRTLANSIPQLAWMANADGWIYWYNKRWYDFTGTTLEEMQGWQWEKVQHPDLAEGVKKRFKDALAKGEPWEDTFLLKSKTGEFCWFLSRALPVRDAQGHIVKWFGTNTDISDQLQAQEDLKKTRDQLDLMLRNVPAQIILLDKHYNIVFANDKTARFFGYGSAAQLVESNLNDFRKRNEELFEIFDEDGSRIKYEETAIARAFATRKEQEALVYVRRKKNSGITWLFSTATPLLNDNGEVNMVLTSTVDITVQKEAEKQIRQSEENFRVMAEALPHLVWTTDAKGSYIFASIRWKQFSGLNPKEVSTWVKMVHPDDLPALTKKWTYSLATGITYKSEVRLRNLDGDYRWHYVHGEPVRNEQFEIVKWAGAFTDIHEQKMAEEGLRQSDENFRQLADFVPQIIWTSGPDGALDYYNKRWYDFTGFKKNYGDQSWVPILHPDDVQPCLDTWYNSVNSGAPYLIEYRFKDRHNGGSYRWFLGKALPVRDKEGNILKWFGTCTDIHDQKMLAENLELIVHQRTVELERSNDDLQQFAHITSHDLQEPLRKIRIYSGRLQKEYNKILPDKAQSYLDKIEKSGERMYNMIDGILTYSGSIAKNEMLEDIDLNAIIRNIENDLEVVIQHKSAKIYYENLPVIRGIAIPIHQLFYNLINNALKFSRTDVPVVIYITSATVSYNEIKSQLSGTGIASEYYHAISITDNGIGFAANEADIIFSTFTRLHSKDLYEGTGLGLALCRKIMERHNGAITASGIQDEGAIFTIYLPENL